MNVVYSENQMERLNLLYGRRTDTPTANVDGTHLTQSCKVFIQLVIVIYCQIL